MTTYELRTASGARILAFDDRLRAEQERDDRQPRYGDRPLELWRVRMVEEKVA